MWWQDAVVYQIYPRSFQDSNGDGIGDLPGIVQRLDHVKALGADAIWLSPFYPSPNADFGYDVADYTDVDPAYGTLADFTALADAAHDRGLRLLVDFVPCHTSTSHPWFRHRPDFYFWADAPPNNWQATFGGGAWEQDPVTGRYYLHSFFPEQADLNWRHPGVVEAITGALRFWRRHGVDGFRLDAVDRLLKDPELRDDPPATRPFGLPLHDEYARLRHVHSANAPDIGIALQAMRDAAGDALLVGEVYLPAGELAPYLETLDVVFAFEAMNAGPDAERLRAAIAEALGSGESGSGRSGSVRSGSVRSDSGQLGWVLSNHDFERFATRFGRDSRAAALLFLTLPGPVFVYQGDELGTPDGPGVTPPLDRHDRDRFRHPMPWAAGSQAGPHGGFTTGTPWLPAVDPERRNVADQAADLASTLSLFRRAIHARRQLAGPAEVLDSPPGTIVIRRARHMAAINLGAAPAAVLRPAELVIEARPGDGRDPAWLPPGGGWLARDRSHV